MSKQSHLFRITKNSLSYCSVLLIEHESRSCRNLRALPLELFQLNLDRSSLSPPRGLSSETWMMIMKTWVLCLERWSSASVAPLVLWVDLVALAGPICLF